MEKLQVIGISGSFPGPIVNVTTNWNVVINVRNHLDEPLLVTWYATDCFFFLSLDSFSPFLKKIVTLALCIQVGINYVKR